MLNALFRSGRTVLPRCSGILVRCESTIRSLQEDLPAVRSPELLPATDYPDPCNFNYTAIMDWGLYKFDADLFKFHEVLTVDEWIELVGRGEVIESELNDMDYNKVLSTSEITTKVMERISQLGLFKLRIPTEYGGLDYNDTACAYLHEILGICPSIARVVGESEEMGVMLLKKFGTLEQKETYLPRLAKGQSFVSMAFLEPGSTMLDANSYRKTNAKQVGDKFIITGRKHWVYNAKFADVFLVFATHTAQDDTGPIQLETIFLIDKNTEGVRVHSPVKKTWFRGLDLCEVIFDEVEVGFDRIVGGMGNGFKVLREVIKQNRTSTVSECSAAMKRLVHDITHRIKDDNYAKSLPALRHIEVALGEISCLAYAVETLAYYGASRNDFYAGADMTIETWLAKIFAYQALPDAIQIYFNAIGKHGFNPGTFVEELVLNAHYYPVLDDSIYDLKLALMYEIIPYIAKQLGTKLKLTKLPQDYPVESFQLRLRQAGALTFVRGLGLEEYVCLNVFGRC
ncbi:UNVERIFIED_CONTAM: hypothetical protein PYX00_003274 [Menopon gallinae]|uniref:Acyl-CoA dehydrogenase n=1 Tax=Menopon gallinae TaxID=328185 RepID=A0AAW2I058_9NEOP